MARRTCVGCRRIDEQSALLRVACRPLSANEVGAEVVADAQRRLPGRGAYVHAQHACVGAALRNGALLRALRLPPGFKVVLRDVVG